MLDVVEHQCNADGPDGSFETSPSLSRIKNQLLSERILSLNSQVTNVCSILFKKIILPHFGSRTISGARDSRLCAPSRDGFAVYRLRPAWVAERVYEPFEKSY